MAKQQNQHQDADIDFRRLFAAIWRDKFLILFGALILTGLVFVALMMITPTYKASTKVLLSDSETVFTRPTERLNGGALVDRTLIDRESVQSQVQVIKSTDLLLKVARQEGLAQVEEFNSTDNVSSFRKGLIAVGLLSDTSDAEVEQKIVEKMLQRLRVFAVEFSRVIVIEFQSEDPELAARIPRAIAEAYVALESQEQQTNTGEAAAFLADEIAQLQQSVRDAEARVADFRAASGLFETGDRANGTLASQQLSELSTELSRVRAERSSIEARVQSVQAALDSGAALDTLPDVISSPLIERLSEQKVQLSAQIADLSTTLLPGHPRIRALRSQLDAQEQQIRDQATKVLEGLRNQVDINRAREDELTLALNEQKAASSRANTQEVELRALEREAASQRSLLESYLIRFREAQSRGEAEFAPAKARIISSDGVPSNPAFPKMLPLVSAALVASIIIMILVTLMRELFSGRAFVPAATSRQAEEAVEDDAGTIDRSEAPSVAVATGSRAKSHGRKTPSVSAPIRHSSLLSASALNDDKAVEPEQEASDEDFSVEAVAAQLLDNGADRAIIVSPEGDAGSVCSVNLVRRLADDGVSVILLDLTATGASSQFMLSGEQTPFGITDLLASQAQYSDVIHADAATNADLIPIGNADMELAMRGIDRLPIILEALASAYEVVVVDCGSTDAASIGRLVSENTQIVFSLVEPNSGEVAFAADDFVENDYENVLIMSADEIDNGDADMRKGRKFAAS